MKLYEIADEYQRVLNEAIDPETGEINENALARLDEIKTDGREKILAVSSFIKNIEAERNAIIAAKASMEKRENKINENLEWLDDYLKTNMQRCGITEISSPYFIVRLKKSSTPKVNVLNEVEIPKRYIKEKVTTSVDRTQIRKDILDGMPVPGASLSQSFYVQIK